MPPSAQNPRKRHHFEISPTQAVVRMFGSINHFPPSRFPFTGAAEALCFSAHVATLHTISKSSCSPLVSQAAEVMLTISRGVQVRVLSPRYRFTLNYLQSSRFNKDNFVRLAKHGCTLVSAIIITWQQREREGKILAPEILASLSQLVKYAIYFPSSRSVMFMKKSMITGICDPSPLFSARGMA